VVENPGGAASLAGADSPTWAVVRRVGRGLTETRAAAAGWAIDRLESAFGPSWPARQYETHGRIPNSLIAYGMQPAALIEMLSLAARIDRFADDRTSREVLGVLRGAPDDSAWWHALLQLEVARAGASFGATASFEPRMPGSPGRGDVLLQLPDRTVMVETSTLSRARRDREWEDYERAVRLGLEPVARELSLRVELTLNAHPEPEQAAAWIASAVDSARRAARNSISVVLENDWVRATFEPHSSSPGIASFVGATHYRDGWVRVRRMLREKIGQTTGATAAVWLRVDDRDALFRFGDWVRSPFQERIDVIAAAIRGTPDDLTGDGRFDSSHIAGVIVSSGLLNSAAERDVPQDETAVDDAGAVLMRRRIAAHVIRETVIVALSDIGQVDAERWRAAYSQEATWLDQDLHERGFAPVAALTR